MAHRSTFSIQNHEGDRTMSISIGGISKAAVLAALYNASKPQGLDFIQYDPKPMSAEEAEAILKQTMYFDYLYGRVMKISLKKDEVDTRRYNRDNGENAAEMAIEALRQSNNPNADSIQKTHSENTLAAAIEVEQHMDDESRMEGCDTLSLGFPNFNEHLVPTVHNAAENRD